MRTAFEIYEIFVVPARRREGIASECLHLLEAEAVGNGYGAVLLKPSKLDSSAVSTDTLRRWYASQGYATHLDNAEAMIKRLGELRAGQEADQ